MRNVKRLNIPGGGQLEIPAFDNVGDSANNGTENVSGYTLSGVGLGASSWTTTALPIFLGGALGAGLVWLVIKTTRHG